MRFSACFHASDFKSLLPQMNVYRVRRLEYQQSRQMIQNRVKKMFFLLPRQAIRCLQRSLETNLTFCSGGEGREELDCRQGREALSNVSSVFINPECWILLAAVFNLCQAWGTVCLLSLCTLLWEQFIPVTSPARNVTLMLQGDSCTWGVWVFCYIFFFF